MNTGAGNVIVKINAPRRLLLVKKKRPRCCEGK